VPPAGHWWKCIGVVVGIVSLLLRGGCPAWREGALSDCHVVRLDSVAKVNLCTPNMSQDGICWGLHGEGGAWWMLWLWLCHGYIVWKKESGVAKGSSEFAFRTSRTYERCACHSRGSLGRSDQLRSYSETVGSDWSGDNTDSLEIFEIWPHSALKTICQRPIIF
jgi:hypothetical protein